MTLAGCAASIEPVPITGPDGMTAYYMRCSGAGRTRLACLEKAGELCPAGYAIVDESNRVIGFATPQGGAIGTRSDIAVSCR